MAGSDTETKLIESSLSGDPEAYAVLVKQHQPMIRAMAFRMTGCHEPAPSGRTQRLSTGN